MTQLNILLTVPLINTDDDVVEPDGSSCGRSSLWSGDGAEGWIRTGGGTGSSDSCWPG